MRFMIQLCSQETTALGDAKRAALVAATARYYDELRDAGALIAVEGLLSSAQGVRIALRDGRRTMLNGPFHEPKAVSAAFWIIDVNSKREAIAWAQRCPLAEGDLLEIRQLCDPEPFLLELTREIERFAAS